MVTVVVTNPNAQVLARVKWQRAARLLAIDVANNVSGTPVVKTVRSPSLVVTVHAIVAINKDAYRPWNGKSGDSHASANMILTRDRWTCAYCGEPGSTIDHIFPHSRGGAGTFMNLVAACHACNNYKADRTPHEAGMQLRFAPYVYDPWAPDQKMVHELFELTDTQSALEGSD